MASSSSSSSSAAAAAADAIADSSLPNPLHQNLWATLVPIGIVVTVVGGCDFLVQKKWLAPQISRKVVHVAAGCWILSWPLFHIDHWTWTLNALVPVVYSILLIIKGAILRDPNDSDVQTMTRTGNPTELLMGPLHFTIVMSFCGLYLFPEDELQKVAILIMACLGFGDGIAPLMGQYFPMGRYPTYPFGPHNNDTKTLSGSAGFFISSLMGYSLFHSVVIASSSEGAADWEFVVRVVTVATVTEGIAGPYDNILVPLIIYGMCMYLK